VYTDGGIIRAAILLERHGSTRDSKRTTYVMREDGSLVNPMEVEEPGRVYTSTPAEARGEGGMER